LDKEKIFRLFYDRKFDFFKVEMKMFIEKLENYSLMSFAKKQLLFRFDKPLTHETIITNVIDDKVYSRTPAYTSTSIKKKIFTQIEVEAIMDGVNKHGVGNWVLKLFTIIFPIPFNFLFFIKSKIKNDLEFKEILECRTNIDLKDKFRNLNKKSRREEIII